MVWQELFRLDPIRPKKIEYEFAFESAAVVRSHTFDCFSCSSLQTDNLIAGD